MKHKIYNDFLFLVGIITLFVWAWTIVSSKAINNKIEIILPDHKQLINIDEKNNQIRILTKNSGISKDGNYIYYFYDIKGNMINQISILEVLE